MTYFLKIENIRKQVHWNRRFEASAFTFYWGFKKKKHFTLTFYKMVQSLYKNWLLVSEITWGIWKTFDKQWKVQKIEIWWLLLSKKYTSPKKRFVKLKHYIHRIYLTLLSTTCVKIHQVTHVIFETISHFSRHNFSVFL